MNLKLIAYAAWVVMLGTTGLMAAYYGWSPYADGSGAPSGPGGRSAYYHGPMHK